MLNRRDVLKGLAALSLPAAVAAKCSSAAPQSGFPTHEQLGSLWKLYLPISGDRRYFQGEGPEERERRLAAFLSEPKLPPEIFESIDKLAELL